MTKREAVEKTLADLGTPNLTFDYALPQGWLDAEAKRLQSMLRVTGKQVDVHVSLDDCYIRILGQTVWAYPVNSCFGQPLPITDDGREVASLLKW